MRQILPGARLHRKAFFGFLTILIASFVLAASSADSLLASGQVDKAIAQLESQIHASPTAKAYNELCRAQFELDAWDAGIPLCEKAVAIDPSVGLYHLWLGRIYGEKAERVNFIKATGLAKKLRVEFERAVQLSPNSWEAHTDLAEFYLEAPGIVGGGEDKARAQADSLLSINPAMAHWVRARIAQKKKDNTVAEREYRAAIDVSNGGARAWTNLAGFYRHVNRLDDMERALQTMETRPLDRPAALMDGANMLFRSSRGTPMAIRFIRRYLSTETTEEWPAFKAHNLLGELLQRQGDQESAKKEFRACLKWPTASTRRRKVYNARDADFPMNSVAHVRIDKFLWAARFFKTRSLASRACELGRIRSNSQPAKASREVKAGDMLNITNDGGDFEIEVLALSDVRGSASIAQSLYRETDTSRDLRRKAAAERRAAREFEQLPTTRPSKRDRRRIIQFRGRS